MARRFQIIVLACAAAAAGCGDTQQEDDLYLEMRRQEETMQREAATRGAGGVEQDAEAIRLVKESAAPDEQGTNEDWVRRQTEGERTSVYFPVWKASPRGLSKFEVTYSCTVVVDERNVIEKRGFAWNVDLVLRLVTPPREMRPDELSSRAVTRATRHRSKVESEIPKLE
jgi:hypothetical protein